MFVRWSERKEATRPSEVRSSSTSLPSGTINDSRSGSSNDLDGRRGLDGSVISREAIDVKKVIIDSGSDVVTEPVKQLEDLDLVYDSNSDDDDLWA